MSILGRNLVGMLDTGATITVLKNSCILKSLNIPIYSIRSTIKTADGTTYKISEIADVPIFYEDKCHHIKIVIAPFVKQNLYLGMNFGRAFGIKIDLSIVSNYISSNMSINEISDVPVENSILTKDQARKLQQTKTEFLAAEDDKIGSTTVLEHVIDTGNSLPVKQRHYPISPYQQEKVNTELDRMLKLGVIQESYSSWNSPLVVVPKSNSDKIRICLDSRKLNAVTVPDAYPLPFISSILSRLPGTKYISALDLKDAFWQVPLSVESRPKTAFTVPLRGHFEFVRMPFGLRNAAQTMCRLMDKVLKHDLEPYVFVYLDDIVIVTPTFELHLEMLRTVAKRLKSGNLYINILKSSFCVESLKYLGYIIDHEGMRIDPDKVSCIVNYPVPKTIKEVRRFMGMTSYYRRFVNDFSAISTPITSLTSTKNKFVWTPEAHESFLKLKSALISSPVLICPDYKKPFTIHCDASNLAVGAVITQGDPPDERPIAYMSKKLNNAEINYTVTEKEFLAIVLALEHFRCYVEGTQFKVVSDHASLKWMNNLKIKNGRIARWIVRLQCFDFEVIYKKGSLNTVPDALSRIEENEDELYDLNAIDFDYKDDVEYLNLIMRIKTYPQDFSKYKIENDFVYYYKPLQDYEFGDHNFQWKLFVPQSVVPDILRKYHDEHSHFGIEKTLFKIKLEYYWPTMYNDVKTYLRNCDVCQRCKFPNTKSRCPMGKSLVANEKWELLTVDFITPLPRSKKGNTAILLISDWLTKFTLAYPLRTADAKKLCDTLEKQFLMFGCPKRIISDNGGQFISKAYQDLLRRYQIKAILTAYYHPQANPVERINRTIEASIRAYHSQNHREWDESLDKIMSSYRSVKHHSTQFGPYFLMFGKEFRSDGNYNPISTEYKDNAENQDKILEVAKKNLLKSHEENKKRYDLRTKPIEYTIGEKVYRRNFQLSKKIDHFSAKLGDQFVPCEVVDRIASGIYRLRDNNGRLGNYHTKDMKKGIS